MYKKNSNFAPSITDIANMKNEITILSVNELPKAAAWLSEMIERSGRRIVALRAQMGAGKTTLVGEFCRSRGVESPISSPTFALVNPYNTMGGEVIYHFDFYRIDSEREALDMGVFDYFDSGNICFVEWPEKIEGILDQCEVLIVDIEVTGDTSRRLTATL